MQGSMSHLQELTVSKLDEQTLQRIVHLCPLLHTLSIQYYVEYYDELIILGVSSETSLHLINNSSIKTLCLANCVNLHTEVSVTFSRHSRLLIRVWDRPICTTVSYITYIAHTQLPWH